MVSFQALTQPFSHLPAWRGWPWLDTRCHQSCSITSSATGRGRENVIKGSWIEIRRGRNHLPIAIMGKTDLPRGKCNYWHNQSRIVRNKSLKLHLSLTPSFFLVLIWLQTLSLLLLLHQGRTSHTLLLLQCGDTCMNSSNPSNSLQSFKSHSSTGPLGHLLWHGLLHGFTGPDRTLLQHGIPTGSQPPSGIRMVRPGHPGMDLCSLVGLMGHSCLSMVCTMACQGISALTPLLLPSSLTWVSVGGFCSRILTPPLAAIAVAQ